MDANEQPATGKPYRCSYLFDTETKILITNPDDTVNAHIVTENSEVSKVIGLIEVPHYKQTHWSGWYIESSQEREVSRKESRFDELVRRLSPNNDPGFYKPRYKKVA